jgi:TRAP-type uncharacterized transport system fused permease subunit
VGLSAYAASAISGADPVKTGIQGFLYDIRTALLPFMFLFNPRLLLIGVHGVLEFLWVVLSATAGMFAFASATQGFLLRPNRKSESLLLLLATWLLFRPGTLGSVLPGGDLTGSLIGGIMFALVFWLQHTESSCYDEHT